MQKNAGSLATIETNGIGSERVKPSCKKKKRNLPDAIESKEGSSLSLVEILDPHGDGKPIA